MSRMQTSVAICLLGIFAIQVLPSAQNEMKENGIFSILNVGQSLTVREQGEGWSLIYSEVDESELFRVIEIEPTFIRLEDPTEMRELTIPIYAIKSIERLNSANE